MNTQSDIVFSSIIPIFNFKISGIFNYSSKINDAKFSIELKKFTGGQIEFNELVKYADNATKNKLISIHIPPDSLGFCHPADHFLVINVVYPFSDALKVCSNTEDTLLVKSSILTALRLHSSNGLLFHESYEFRYPPIRMGGYSKTRSRIAQNVFFHLKRGISKLDKSDFSNCIGTFEKLMKLEKMNKKSSYKKIINLALDYHSTTFTLKNSEHAFLILMIIFEVLFKKPSDTNITQAALRISKLLAKTKKEAKKIRKKFIEESNCFGEIRNKIAHGDPTLNTQISDSKYPFLYKYVTDAIKELILVMDNKINHLEDYYEEIHNYIGRRFNALPEK